MHPYQLTDSGSILTNAAFAMRFMFPLGYNFLFLNISSEQRSSNKDLYPYLYLFHDMSQLKFIGDPVAVFLPMLVLVFCAATYFDVYGKLLKKLKISRFEFADPDNTRNADVREILNEGKNLYHKFKKELNANPSKMQEFRQYIKQMFSTTLFGTSYANLLRMYQTQNMKNDAHADDVGLLNHDSPFHKQIRKDKHNKLQFVELQRDNDNH